MLREGLIFFMINMGNSKSIEEELLNSFKHFQIEDDEFTIQVYKDQKQFRIADSDALMERLTDINKMHAFYSKDKIDGQKKDEPQASPEDKTEQPPNQLNSARSTNTIDREQMYNQNLMWKFEQSFNKAFSNKNRFYREKIEKVMMVEEYEEIPAKHLAMEIIMRN